MVYKGRFLAAGLIAVAAAHWSGPADAETLAAAMASAYSFNPQLNAARAQLRALDEGVPKATAGYRPTIDLQASVAATIGRSSASPGWGSASYPRTYQLNIVQPIFTGFRTQNSVKMAQTSVLAGREQLKSSEQDVLLDAVTAFMNVVQSQAILNLRAQNVTFLQQQVKASDDRLSVGEGTRTDVAQANASLAQGRSDYAAAVANLNKAIAIYIQVVGHRPTALAAANGIERLIPKSMEEGIAIAIATHPSVRAAAYNVDVAAYNVKIAEGALLPSASIKGTATHSDGADGLKWRDSASVTLGVSVPIYDGGGPAATVRQLKETLGQYRITLDATRDNVRQQVVSAYASLDAAYAQVSAAASQVAADQLALSGVIEERKVGQRTTLDVLNAQQSLLNAQVSQVSAQYNRVVAAYTLVAAVGRLNAAALGLKVNIYDPTEHYDAVRDKWHGLRTPDGR